MVDFQIEAPAEGVGSGGGVRRLGTPTALISRAQCGAMASEKGQAGEEKWQTDGR